MMACYGSISLQQSSKRSCSLHVSGHNLRADRQRLTPAPLFNSCAKAAPVSVQVLPVQFHYSAGTDVCRGILETTDKKVLDSMCLKWDEWSYH